MPLNPAGYPLDLTGIAPSNFITNEVHVINTPRDRLFVPGGGPFYHIGFSIRNSSNNQLLLPNTDYKLLHLHKPAARDSGKDVYTVVYIINETVNSVTIDYHVVGGIHGETADVIRTLLESFPLPDDGDSVAWGQIIGIPTQFTPAEHLHHIDEIYNFNDVVSVLEQLRIAILAGDGPAINAIYQYFHQYLTNADYVTRDELLAITSVVPFFEIKSFPDYDTLRNATTMINGAPGIYCCLGRDNMFDRNGRIFLWDINATAPHNGDTIVRPHIIPNDTVNGRFISFQRVEKDLNLLASSLQRSINFDGTIEDGIINNGRVVLVDADNYLRDGTYWVGDANTIANVPFSWCVMKVDNIVVASNSTNGEVVQTFYNGRGDKATRSRYYDALSAGYIWGPIYWYARREGDAAINFNVKDATQPDHAVNLRQLTSYGGNPLVQFNVADGTQPDHAITLRQFLNTDTDCHLGIVIKYIGSTSVLLPCFIGESGSHGNLVIVYISGSLRLINLADITPVFYGNASTGDIISDGDTGNVYLLRDPANGAYTMLVTSVQPEAIFRGNMTNRRVRLRMSDNALHPFIDVENTTFIGCVYKSDFKWLICRSWFQDPGMVEHLGFYNSPRPDITILPKASGPLAKIDYDDDNYCTNTSMTFLTSDFYNSTMSGIQLLIWGNEKVSFCLNANCVVDHNVNAIRNIKLQLGIERLSSTNGDGYTQVYKKEFNKLSYREPNAFTNGYADGICITDEIVAPTTGIYALHLRGQSSNGDTRGYLLGHHSAGISKTSLAMSVDQYHTYRQLVIASISPAGETLTLTISSTMYSVNLYSFFVAAYGSFGSHPLLTDIIVNITGGASVGANFTNGGALFISSLIPAGIAVTINILNGSRVGGKGGKGGDNSVGSPGGDGENGGPAIFAERTFVVNVTGVLSGGGGGGAAGRFGTSHATGSDGGPGGGGAGLSPGVAGTRATGGGGVDSNSATDGTELQGGIGGTAVFSGSVNGNFSQGQDGGNGGGPGQPGTIGTGGIAVAGDTFVAGLAGRAVLVNPGVTYTVNILGFGSVLGAY